MNKDDKNNKTPLFVVGGFIFVIICGGSIAGTIWGLCLAVICTVLIWIFAYRNEIKYCYAVAGITIVIAISLIVKLHLFYNFNPIDVISYIKEMIGFLKNFYKHKKDYDVLDIYYFSYWGADKYWYSWAWAFILASVVSFVNIAIAKKEMRFKGIQNLKKGKVIEHKDKIEQKKLYKICKEKVNTVDDEIGVDVNTGKPIKIADKVLNTILLILGKTGAGKTEALKNFYYRTIRKKKPLIIINAKPDKSLERDLKRWCEEMNTPFYAFGCLNEDNYDFLNNGGHTAITDKIMALNDVWDNTFFKNRANTYIQNAIYILQQTSKDGNLTLEQFINLFDKTKLEKIVKDYMNGFMDDEDVVDEKELIDEWDGVGSEATDETDEKLSDIEKKITDSNYNSNVRKYFELLDNFDEEQLAGLKDIFTILYTSEMSDSLCSGAKDRKRFDIKGAIERNEVIYFSLNVLEYSTFAPLVGKVAMNDIKAIISKRKEEEYNEPVFVCFDEFSMFAGQQVINILNMGRGLGLHTILGTQGLGDLDDVSETFKEKVMSNVNALLIHTVPSPKTAEYISEWVGTRQAIIETARQDDTGMETGSIRQGDEFIVHPNELKRGLGGGKAFYINNEQKIECKIQVSLVNEVKNEEK